MNVEKERRRFPRCEIKRSLNFRIAGDNYIHIAYIKNLGGAGLCFQSSDGIGESTNVDLEFEIPETLDRIVASGIVIWCNICEDQWARVFDVGVSFTSISDENLEKINNFLDRKTRRLNLMNTLPGGDRSVKKTLLIVDSDTQIIEAMRTLLEPYYHVLTAARGSEAVELTLRRSPDVILLDLLMPDDDGISTLKILKGKENISSIPVITMSAIEQEDKISEAEKHGASAHIAKPFGGETLNQKILEVLAL